MALEGILYASILVLLLGNPSICNAQNLPFIITTWSTTINATDKAWDLMFNQQLDIVDSLVGGCEECDVNKRCGTAVGWGDKPSESGEVTLDAIVIDGRTMEMGAVGCLRRVKNAIGVAHAVLKYTEHTMLVGELATEFALQMGFVEEDLSSSRSEQDWQDWQNSNCQPNFWQNVTPDPATSCGPYTPAAAGVEYSHESAPPASAPNHDSPEPPRPASASNQDHLERTEAEDPNHDTIAMVGIDATGNPAATCTTNGLSHKIPGRSGDSPVPGAGTYAEAGKGAAGATGNGDIMIRFLPSFHMVELMGQGESPLLAAQTVAQRIGSYYPQSLVGLIAVNTIGEYGAACFGLGSFPYHFINPATGVIVSEEVFC